MLVRRRRHGRVAVLELSRPDRRNAIGPELADHLQRAALAVGSDGEVSAVVLTGAGPSFCAGADMKERTAGRSGSAAVLDAVRRASWAVHEIPVPVIGAARGHAIGAGLELLAMCDYRVVEEGTRMGIPEVRQGITSGGGLLALSSLVGRGQLARLAFTGETLEAGTALAMGVVDDVVDQGGSREVALSLAERMAESPRA
ncbi:MAG: enoyl-CoA hydratase/isomerase family protein, partial [Acidimicrobiales bacterium]